MHNRVEAPNLPRSRVEDAKSRESGADSWAPGAGHSLERPCGSYRCLWAVGCLIRQKLNL